MKSLFQKQIAVPVVTVMILLLIINLFVQMSSERSNAIQEAELMITQIESVIQKNEQDVAKWEETRKAVYIVRAQGAAYMLQHELHQLNQQPDLRKLYLEMARLLRVDEIHIFDSSGTIISGTHPEYYGLSMDSGEQVAFFKPMLNNRSLALCQDVTPNTASQTPMMYAMSWTADEAYMVQIGVSPERLQMEQKTNDLPYLFSIIPSRNQTYTYYAVSKADNTILGSSNESYNNKTLADVGIYLPVMENTKEAVPFNTFIDLVSTFCIFKDCGDYYIGITQAVKSLYADIQINLMFSFLYLLFAAWILIAGISYYISKGKQNEEKNKAVLEAVGSGVSAYAIFNLHTGRLLASQKETPGCQDVFRKLSFCHTYEEVVEYVYYPMLTSPKAAVIQKLRFKTIQDKLNSYKTYTVEHTRAETGILHHYQLIFTKLSRQYGEDAFIAIIRNIDSIVSKEVEQQKQLKAALDQAESASHAKTKFLFNMSHDIRTPMNAILGYSFIAEKHIDEPERVLDSLSKLNVAGAHLQRLINDVLDMARIESGKVSFDLKIQHLPTLISSAVPVFSMEIHKKKLQFLVDWDIADEYVLADRLRLEQVGLNLISNAIKYTPEGGTIRYCAVEKGCPVNGFADYVLTVSDNGIGMSREFMENLFHPFEREENTDLMNVQGTGLGLSITKSLIEQMGGTITCESELGKGTVFTIFLKLQIAEKPEITAGTDQHKLRDFTGKRILLVEDNKLNQEIACELLMDYHPKIEIADNGQIAVDMMRIASPGYYDLILMDVHMPVMNGYDATRAIRSLPDPVNASVPIIAMTANVFEEDKEDARKAGMNDHLAKPIDMNRLLETVGKFIR